MIRSLVLLGFLVLLPVLYCQANPEPTDEDVIPDVDAFIEKQNRDFAEGRSTWRAQKHAIQQLKKKDRKKLLGLKKHRLDPSMIGPPVEERAKRQTSTTVPPSSFDVRQKWGACNSSFNDIRDQGNCGSCWAHSSASVISDRICIKSNGVTRKKISTQDQITCMPTTLTGGQTDLWYVPDSTCLNTTTTTRSLSQGFDPQDAMRMYVLKGIVTGGEYNQPSVGCKPYSKNIYTYGTSGLTCAASCSNTLYTTAYTSDRSYGSTIRMMGYTLQQLGGSAVNYTWSVNATTGYLSQIAGNTGNVETLIKREIYVNGPVTVSFDVYSDFYAYASGVYQRTAGSTYDGGHAVKLIGWGVSGRTPYWLCVNSWGTTWGDRGMFKILRGRNHVGIDDYIVTASPK